MNWYNILQLQPFGDEALVKKQYKKLALLLHLDKANIVGAEAAFKLIGEANILLTHENERVSYDIKFKISEFSVPTPPRQSNRSASALTRPNFQTCCNHCGAWMLFKCHQMYNARDMSSTRQTQSLTMLDLNDEHIDDVASDVNNHYPDHPDINDFKKDRIENSFVVGQVWALYDDLDGMKRFYARVDKITSHGFKLIFTWVQVNVHMARAQFCSRRGIYPRKDETWALYKKWNMTRGRNPKEDGLEEDVKASELYHFHIKYHHLKLLIMKHIVKKKKMHEEQCDHTDVEQNENRPREQCDHTDVERKDENRSEE
ncbi:hypothetical protein ACFE04_000437 [Oxalis oulophora]